MQITALAALLAAPLLAAGQDADLSRAQRLVDGEKWARAEVLLEKITTEHPDAGRAWFLLGYARHAQKHYADALEAHRKAAEFASERPKALYNAACAEALLGRLDEATATLDGARAAGFLDFDLLKSDADLAALRAAGKIELAPEREYRELKARNGAGLRYAALLPADFDPEESYPVLIAYPPGSGGPACADWALEHLWGGTTTSFGWIVVVPVAPEQGWMNHPAHHALNDLLKHLRKEYHVEDDRFHMAGFGEGARPAASFALMSKSYFQSLSVASCSAWSGWDDGEIKKLAVMPVHQFVGQDDAHAMELAQRVQDVLTEREGSVSMTILPDEGPLLPSLRDGQWLRAIDMRVR